MYIPGEWKITIYGDTVFASSASKKPNHNAPKTIKGDYDLSIHGNKIVLVDNVDGTTVEAKCHPDDDFDIGVGVKEAFKKLNEKREEMNKRIEVGDWVEIVNPGLSFSTLNYFFKDNNLMQYATRYRYAVTPNKGTQGRVVAIQEGKCVIEVDNDYELGNEDYVGMNCYDTIYIIGYDGLKKVAKPNA